MKIFYKSKIAKLFTFMQGFSTIMLFGAVFTEKNTLTAKTIVHENVHCKQYFDMVGIGFGLSIAVFFLTAAFGLTGYWMLYTLPVLPFLLYYIIYGAEYAIYRTKGYNSIEAYSNIGFEYQARYIADKHNLPCEEQPEYITFGWWTKHFG